jgi:hypothetical protein
MSTAELKEIIDQRTPEERKWMTAYLLDELAFTPPAFPDELISGVKHLHFSSWGIFSRHRGPEPQRLPPAQHGARTFRVPLARSHSPPAFHFALVYSTSS